MYKRCGFYGRILASLAGLLAAATATAGVNRWTAGGPYGGFVRFVVDPGDGSRVYTSGSNGYFRTVDAGASWSREETPGSVLAVSLSDPRVLYTGLSRTEDRGETWVELTRPVSSTPSLAAPISVIVVNPHHAGAIYAAVDYVPLTGGGGFSRGVRLYRSLDAGRTWTLAFNDGYPETDDARWTGALALDTSNPSRLSLAVRSADGTTIHNSSDGGVSWAAATTGPSGGILSLDFGPGSTLFAGTTAGAFRSQGTGAVWTEIDAGLPAEALSWVSLAVDPGSLELVASTAAGIYGSPNGGNDWSVLDASLAPGNLARDRANPARIYYSGQDDRVLRSVDAGAHWSEAASGLTAFGFVSAVRVDPGGKVVYAGTSGGVWRSPDGGLTWANRSRGLPAPAFVREVLLDPTEPTTLYVAASTGVFKSTDGALTWTGPGDGLPESQWVGSLVLDPHSPRTLLAATGGGVYRTEDGGARWEPANEGLGSGVDLRGMSGGVAYASGYGLHRSMDSGRSWTRIESILDDWGVWDLLIDSEDPMRVVAAASGFGVVSSPDGGASWYGSFGFPVYSLARDPRRPDWVYACNPSMVYTTAVSGEPFGQLGSGLEGLGVWELATDPTGTHLYATSTAGVLQYTFRSTREASRPVGANVESRHGRD